MPQVLIKAFKSNEIKLFYTDELEKLKIIAVMNY